jgi:hypothetical protein
MTTPAFSPLNLYLLHIPPLRFHCNQLHHRNRRHHHLSTNDRSASSPLVSGSLASTWAGEGFLSALAKPAAPPRIQRPQTPLCRRGPFRREPAAC